MATWRGVLRELDRAANRNARQRAHKEKQEALVSALEEGSNALIQYENLLSSLVSLHKECCSSIDWDYLSKRDPPKEVSRENHFERIAEEKKKNYRLSSIVKILGRAEKELKKLDEEIILSREKDESTYRSQVEKYGEEFRDWEIEKNLAINVLKGEDQALEQILNTKLSLKSNPFIGKKINFHYDDDKKMTSDLYIHSIDEILPTFDLKLLKSGNLSKKDMPISKRLNIYKEYVCSAVLRLAREIFALLPLDEIVINAKCDQLNERTGYMEEVIFLSAFIPKSSLDKINLQFVEPSIAIDNFKHNMEFKKLSGFKEVQQISM
jgi:hypothetical protein